MYIVSLDIILRLSHIFEEKNFPAFFSKTTANSDNPCISAQQHHIYKIHNKGGIVRGQYKYYINPVLQAELIEEAKFLRLKSGNTVCELVSQVHIIGQPSFLYLVSTYKPIVVIL
jgi:hypothetical protein